MRLTGIRLAGFKSFVEPTRLVLATRMSGVVGPNGCGKSNIVDAIRWVLGESTRNIRGKTMEDIIFDGSARRDRLDRASVEITLEDHQDILEGKYADVNEIQIRREARRNDETASRYYINGTQVRRRDVADLFQGTGLGRGNYSIIAQNMVNDLIEARPEEMRKYLEEAAGISLYQERRRETENSIERTEENLRKAKDALRSLTGRLSHLERQKKDAEKKRGLESERDTLQAQLASLQLRDEKEQLQKIQADYDAIDERCQAVERERAGLREEYDRKKDQFHVADRAKDAALAAYYQAQQAVNELDSRRRAHEEHRQRQADESAERATRIAQQEAHLAELKERREHLNDEAEPVARNLLATLGDAAPSVLPVPENLQSLLEAGEHYMGTLREKLRIASEEQQRRVAELEQIEHNLEEKRHTLGRLRGECEGLRARQQVELAGDTEARAAQEQMLAALSLSGTCLADTLRVADGWEFAVETVLAERLGAFCIDADLAAATEQRVAGQAALLTVHRGDAAPAEPGTLAAQVTAPVSMRSLLGAVYVADSLAEAEQRRTTLAPHQSVILRNGLWLGADWNRWPAEAAASTEGVVARQRKIEEQQRTIEQLEQEISTLEQTQGHLKQQDAGTDGLRARQDDLERNMSSARHLSERLTDVGRAVEREQERLDADMQRHSSGTPEQEPVFDAGTDEEALRETKRIAEQRKEETRQQAENRHAEMDAALRSDGEKEEEEKQYRQKRHDCALEKQNATNRCEQHQGTLSELKRDYEEVLRELPPEAQPGEWEPKYNAIVQELAQMGPTNDAAFEEFEELTEEKAEAERQHADITASLVSLQKAMKQIDQDTRVRLEEAYNQVNEHLGQIFPRIIGPGGRAQLVRTETNILEAGIEVQACPPGKRVRTMHMLSGGEQAMVAAAMMLAFFRYKPAPFCILDEVDAPLSDDNLRRFCDILAEMSETVQFLVVTHSKITMEYASQLVGVTMHEPGVSRLVDVNVEQAVEMVEQAEENV